MLVQVYKCKPRVDIDTPAQLSSGSFQLLKCLKILNDLQANNGLLVNLMYT